MDDLSKPPIQSSVLDQFDLDHSDLDRFDQGMDEQCSQRQQPVKSVAPRTRHSRPKVIAISAIPVIDTPAANSSQDTDILDIPILTTPYSTSQSHSSHGKTGQPVQLRPVPDAKVS